MSDLNTHPDDGHRHSRIVFGIPGAKIDKVFDTLSDSKIRTVATTSLTAPESISALNLVTGRKRLTVSIVW
jgi:hypothetical protein